MLSIIIPVHNEQENIVDLINRIENFLDIPYELVVINDHSTDSTKELVNKLSKQHNNIRQVENKLEQGVGNALKTGFENIMTELIVPVMGDLCDDLSTIKKMLDKINEGYDIVCGCRYIKEGARLGGSKIKGFFSWFVGRSLHYLLGLPTYDIANAFKMYRRKVIDKIDIKSKGFEISMEIPLKAYFLGYKITEVPTTWMNRKEGESKFGIFKHGSRYLKLYLWALWKKISRI